MLKKSAREKANTLAVCAPGGGSAVASCDRVSRGPQTPEGGRESSLPLSFPVMTPCMPLAPSPMHPASRPISFVIFPLPDSVDCLSPSLPLSSGCQSPNTHCTASLFLLPLSVCLSLDPRPGISHPSICILRPLLLFPHPSILPSIH